MGTMRSMREWDVYSIWIFAQHGALLSMESAQHEGLLNMEVCSTWSLT